MQQVSSVHCRMRNVSRDTFRGLPVSYTHLTLPTKA